MKEQDKTFFDDRGQEFYKDSNRPVYPHRNLSTPPNSEGKERPLSENPHALGLLNRLGELEKRTRPEGGPSTSQGKDLAAFDALCAAGELVRYVAGWAIDHEIGLAVMGLGREGRRQRLLQARRHVSAAEGARRGDAPLEAVAATGAAEGRG